MAQSRKLKIIYGSGMAHGVNIRTVVQLTLAASRPRLDCRAFIV